MLQAIISILAFCAFAALVILLIDKSWQACDPQPQDDGPPDSTAVTVDMDALRWALQGIATAPDALGPYQLTEQMWYTATTLLGVDWEHMEYAWYEARSFTVAHAYVNMYLLHPLLTACGPNLSCEVDATLAAYHAGERAVIDAYKADPANWQNRLPKQTREFISRYHRYRKTHTPIIMHGAIHVQDTEDQRAGVHSGPVGQKGETEDRV